MSVVLTSSYATDMTNESRHPSWECHQKNDDDRVHLRRVETVLLSLNFTEREYDILRNISGLVFPYNVDNNNPSTFCYCETFREFSLVYKEMHGYLSLAVCLFGVISNLLNIIVLSRREMSILPINRILRWLAVTDILLMVEYIPFVFFYYIRVYPNLVHSYKGAVFTFMHVNFTQVLHTISIFMTLALAFWRYIVIKYPQRNATLSNRRKCNRSFILAYLLPIALCLPSYLVFDINEFNVVEDGREVIIYAVHLSELAVRDDELYFTVYLWVYAVIIKLIPCIILTLTTCWLIKTLKSASDRRNVLISQGRSYSPPIATNTSMATTVITVVGGNENCSHCEKTLLVQHNGGAVPHVGRDVGGYNLTGTLKHHRIDRTTRILIAVLVLFVITELPQGILGLLSGIYGKKFFTTCYVLLGDVMDLLALFNGAVNFILYCWMSKQFRKTFGQLFKPTILLSNLIPATQDVEMVTTNV